ncbi:unnamed protein product [Adineta steineri]|uniref:PLAC8 family protein n=3 Tax=Adineta steineri TaxID=433720 RepID=A0A814G8Q0_9BILA|nr:unnamed protein product [Adineta steineri]CAF1289927.1 unnamed protein product [Adineta steineri]
MSGANDWNESLFGCFDDWGSCCYGTWCTPCLFGSNAEKISDHHCVGMCCLYSILASCYLCWLPHWFERDQLRKNYDLRPNPACGDALTTICCSACALCQEARELKSRARSRDIYRTNGPTVVTQPAPGSRVVFPDVFRA